jgi:hypothetical protein
MVAIPLGFFVVEESTGLTFVSRGDSTTLSDSSGNVFGITADGHLTENGSNIPGGGGSAQFTVFNDELVAQDANSGNWFRWTGSIFESTDPPPGAPPNPLG